MVADLKWNRYFGNVVFKIRNLSQLQVKVESSNGEGVLDIYPSPHSIPENLEVHLSPCCRG